MKQGDLFGGADRKPSAFERWIATPHGQEAYRLFVKYARAVHARGKRIGAKAIWERMRWQAMVRNRDDQEEYKLNNNYFPRVARKAMREYPELEGFFQTRELKNP